MECNPRATAGNRLKPVTYAADDGFQFGTTWFFDHERETQCYLQSTHDGTLRCLPRLRSDQASAVPAYFADAACTRAATSVSPCREDRYVVVAYPEAPEDVCSATVTRVYELAAQVAPAYILDTGGACVEHAEDGDWVFRELGAEVPIETFVAFTSSR